MLPATLKIQKHACHSCAGGSSARSSRVFTMDLLSPGSTLNQGVESSISTCVYTPWPDMGWPDEEWGGSRTAGSPGTGLARVWHRFGRTAPLHTTSCLDPVVTLLPHAVAFTYPGPVGSTTGGDPDYPAPARHGGRTHRSLQSLW